MCGGGGGATWVLLFWGLAWVNVLLVSHFYWLFKTTKKHTDTQIIISQPKQPNNNPLRQRLAITDRPKKTQKNPKNRAVLHIHARKGKGTHQITFFIV